MRAAVLEGRILNCNVLHRVLYPQVHENGLKKNNRKVIHWVHNERLRTKATTMCLRPAVTFLTTSDPPTATSSVLFRLVRWRHKRTTWQKVKVRILA